MIYVNPNVRASYRDGYVIATFICDTAAELPATNYLTGYTLEMGSTAHVIENATDYTMQSNGTWCTANQADLQTIITTLSDVESRLTDAENDIITLQGDVNAVETVIDNTIKPALSALINDGAKNRLKITATDTTTSGIQFTINPDGTVSADGVNPDKRATGNIYFQLGTMEIKSGDVIHLSGCPAGGSYASGYAFYIDYQGGSTLAYDEGSGATYTATENRTLRCRIIIRSGTEIDNVTFSPMITPQIYYSITPDFRIYAPTNRELYEMI